MFHKSLPNIVFSAGLLLPIVTLNAQKAIANHLDFNIHNQTAYPIVELYVSNSAHPTWEEDVLGLDVLPSGETTSADGVMAIALGVVKTSW